MRMPAVQKQFQQQLLLSTYSPLPLQCVHLQKQNRFASEDGFCFTATFDTTPLTVRASYTVGTGWYHHGNSTSSGFSGGRPHCVVPDQGGCDWTEVSLSSFHVIALHPATGCFQRTVFARYHILRFQWLSTATVVVFAHPIRACRPGFTPGYGWKRMFSIGWIFCFQSAESFPLTP